MNSDIIATISRIREGANRLILQELKKAGAENLSPSHGDILAVLFDANEITMHELAKRIHRTKATTTVLVDKLEKFGYLYRGKAAQDNRCVVLTLTDKGQSFKPKFQEISEKLNNTALSGLSLADIEQLEKLLKKIQNNL